MVVFYEPNPAADGTRGVVYLDGHVSRVKAEDWARVKKQSKIP
jgi:prepilin-type processing-associated H-X9-DG protein